MGGNPTICPLHLPTPARCSSLRRLAVEKPGSESLIGFKGVWNCTFGCSTHGSLQVQLNREDKLGKKIPQQKQEKKDYQKFHLLSYLKPKTEFNLT